MEKNWERFCSNLVGTVYGKATAFVRESVAFLFRRPTIKELPDLALPALDVDDTTAAFYEKVYFDSLETREKLIARMQVPLAMVLSIAGAQSYMALSTALSRSGWMFWLYAVLLLAAFITLLRAAQYFRGVLSGHSYLFIPTLSEFEDFRVRTIERFSGQSEGDEFLEDWTNITLRREILKNVIISASHNALRNDVRSNFSWAGHKLLMYSGVLTAMAFATFRLADLREIPIHQVELISELPTKQHTVDIVGSVRLKGINSLGSELNFIGGNRPHEQ